MRCRICAWLCDRFCPPSMGRKDFWLYVYHWEQRFSRRWEPYDEDEDRRERANAIGRSVKDNPREARSGFEALADEGSAWAARWAGHLHNGAHGMDRDLEKAEDYYYKALLGGSWMASLEFAKLLFKNEINEKWEGILENGDEVGFVPSSFWLAWYRYERRPKRSTARAVRELFEKAAAAGHPGAQYMLATWKARGKFGLGEIRQGFRDMGPVVADFEATIGGQQERCDEDLEIAA